MPYLRTLLAALVAAVGLAAALGATPARADVSPFPMSESFTDGTFSSSAWHTGGSAFLTASNGTDAPGNGWLRLTQAANTQFGYVVDDTPFPDDNGILVDFDYATYGGNGADGLSFFLYDGNTAYGSFNAGAAGGSLGYAGCPSAHPSVAGVPGAYIGVGFDEWGNFTNLADCGLDGSTFHPNYVSVRGSQADNYQLLTSVPTSESLMGDRANSRHVTVSVTPDLKMSVYIRYPDGTYQTVTRNYQLPAPPTSGTLKFGFAGSTGGYNNIHEIRQTKVVKPADLTTTIAGAPAHDSRAGTYTWTTTVANSTDNDTVASTIQATAPGGSLDNVSWTCTASDPVPDPDPTTTADCGPSSGSGLPDTIVDLPKGAKVTYTVTAQASGATDYASLRVDAEPTGATGELNPTDNVATSSIDLDPVTDADPAIAVTDSTGYTGSATSTAGSYRGGDLTITRNWQACDAGDATGSTCADIAGATGTTYSIGAGMHDNALRLREHVANSQGSLDAYSAIYDTRPDTAITVGPSGLTTSHSASFTATTATSGARLQYRLDGGAWTQTTSPTSLGSLADGPHTFAVRALYAGLADQTPDGFTWTVDSTAPAAPAVTSPAAGLVTNDTAPTLTLTGEPGAALTVEVDGVTHQVTVDGGGQATLTLAGPLADGPHTVRARATDPAGNVGAWSGDVAWTVKTSTHVDLTAPVAGPTATDLPTVAFTGEPGATYAIEVDGHVVATGVIDGTGTASLPLPTALGDGAHVITVTVTDAAGNQDTRSASLTVDTAAPAVTIDSAPAQSSSLRDPAFTFTGEPGARLECSLDGAIWTICASPLALSDLADGPHVLAVHAVDAAGNVSADQQYAWTVDTAKPAAPALLGGPDAQTTARTAGFEVQAEPGATLECSVDGGAFAPCSADVVLTGLTPGGHSLAVRQTDAAGNTSDAGSYQWQITADPKGGQARHVSAVMGAASTVAGRRVASVGCNLDGGALSSCSVSLYYQGHVIGRAFKSVQGTKAKAVVRVKLNQRGRRLLRRALGGLPVTAKVTARTTHGRRLRSRTTSTLFPPTVFSVPVLFDTARFDLGPVATRVVRQIARSLGHARTVTCEGYTDSRSGAAYNRRLGLDRARTVCARLRRLGVHAHVRAMSYGETRPAASNLTANGRRLNRRVLVHVAY